eukprot:2563772-Rhodomonas_salina.1
MGGDDDDDEVDHADDEGSPPDVAWRWQREGFCVRRAEELVSVRAAQRCESSARAGSPRQTTAHTAPTHRMHSAYAACVGI